MASNAKQKTNNGSKRQNENVALNGTMALSAKRKMNDGFERQTKMWLWMPNMKWTMALSAKIKMNNDFERRNEDVALNAKRENERWLWPPNGKMNNGSERQTEKRQ